MGTKRIAKKIRWRSFKSRAMEGKWTGKPEFIEQGNYPEESYGKTAGIVGLGRLEANCQKGKSLEMRVIATQRKLFAQKLIIARGLHTQKKLY